MTTEEKINQLQAQIDELRKEVKPKFEVGKWYKYHNAICCYNGNNEGYGISSSLNWASDCNMTSIEFWTPATDKEVEEALIKEAERRGFKRGVKIKNEIGTWNICGDRHFFVYEKNKLDFGYECNIFNNGFWAEIIKDEPIKVGCYDVKKELTIDGYIYRIGCKIILENDVAKIRAVMISNEFKKVAFDGIEVELDTIERILKL